MNIKFSDLFKQEANLKYKITFKEVRETIEFPDSSRIINIEDLQIYYFLKKIKNHYLLVECQFKEDYYLVGNTFKVIPNIISESNSNDPFIILQYLASKFGITLKIGNQFNRFIFKEDVELPKNQEQIKLIELINVPKNHSFLSAMYYKIEKNNTKEIVKCALVFTIDTTLYYESILSQTQDIQNNAFPIKIFPKKEIGEQLIKNLLDCKKGRESWREYEIICSKIFEFLFADNFDPYYSREQIVNYNKIERRDLLVANRIKKIPSFWSLIKDEFSSNHIICESKNYTKKIGKDEIHQSDNYTNRALGNFGIIFCRMGMDKAAYEVTRRIYYDSDKKDKVLILVLDDEDVIKMINFKIKGTDPVCVLQEKKEEFEVKY
jgi:hypothetical protein